MWCNRESLWNTAILLLITYVLLVTYNFIIIVVVVAGKGDRPSWIQGPGDINDCPTEQSQRQYYNCNLVGSMAAG